MSLVVVAHLGGSYLLERSDGNLKRKRVEQKGEMD